MIQRIINLLFIASMAVFPVVAQETSTAQGDAVAEAVRRQVYKVELERTLEEARAAQAKGDHVAAAQLFDKCVELVAKISTGVEEEAKQVYEGFITERMFLAREAYEGGALFQADQQLKRILAVQPRSEPALELKARVDAAIKAQEGLRPSEEILSTLPDYQKTNTIAATLVQDGRVLYEAGQLELALEKLQEAVRLNPNNKAAFYYIDLIMQRRFSNENDIRESASKKWILEVTEAWNEPIKRDQLPTPNPMARTNLVYTSQGRHGIYDKLHRIKLDEVTWDGVPLSEVVKALNEESKMRDPERRGVNIMIAPNLETVAPPAPAIDPNTGLPLPVPQGDLIDLGSTIIRIVPPLNNINLAQALDAIKKVADRPIKYSVEDYAIVFSLEEPQTPRLFTRFFKIDPNTFYQGLQGVTAFDFGTGSGGVGGSGGGGGGRGGGGGGSRGGGGGGGGGFGGQGGGQGGQQQGGSEYVGVSLAGSRRNSGFGNQGGGGGGGGGITGGIGGGGNNNQNGGGGVRFLTQESNLQTVTAAVIEFFRAAGVPLDPPKSVFFNDRLGMLMVRATMEELDIVEKAVQILNMSPPQVTIESKFAEITQDDTRALGFDWFLGNTLFGNGKVGAQAGTAPSYGSPGSSGSPANPSGIFPGPSAFDPVTGALVLSPGVVGTSGSDNLLTGGLRNSAPSLATITGILTDPQFRVVIRALDQREGVDLLSAPKVTTMSSRQTQIKVVDVRYIVVDLDISQTAGGGVNTAAVTTGTTGGGAVGSALQPLAEPFELGPVLDVVPYVSADGYTVQMTIIPTIKEFVGYDLETAQLFSAQVQSVGGNSGASNPLTQTTPLPIFRLRQVVTSAVVWDGQTIVLGGLISENVSKIKDKVPVLGDLPLVGRFFRSESNTTMKKNLLIFVTPTIIDPAGNRVHSEEDLPFAQNTFPTQAAIIDSPVNP